LGADTRLEVAPLVSFTGDSFGVICFTSTIVIPADAGIQDINTNTLNEMLKRVQHDKKKRVIPDLFRNLGFGQ
jgi:hypothetical protein